MQYYPAPHAVLPCTTCSTTLHHMQYYPAPHAGISITIVKITNGSITIVRKRKY
jgi:hypothetical protein